MTRKQKKMLWRILISFLLFIAAVFLPTVWLTGPIPLLSAAQDRNGCGAYALARWPRFLIPYLVIGWDVLWKAIRNIANGQVFDENFLMAIATVGALAIGEYSKEPVQSQFGYHIIWRLDPAAHPDLIAALRQEVLDQLLTSLAQQAQVTVNEAALAAIDVPTVYNAFLSTLSASS